MRLSLSGAGSTRARALAAACAAARSAASSCLFSSLISMPCLRAVDRASFASAVCARSASTVGAASSAIARRAASASAASMRASAWAVSSARRPATVSDSCARIWWLALAIGSGVGGESRAAGGGSFESNLVNRSSTASPLASCRAVRSAIRSVSPSIAARRTSAFDRSATTWARSASRRRAAISAFDARACAAVSHASSYLTCSVATVPCASASAL